MKAKLIKRPMSYRLIVENFDYDYGHTYPEDWEHTHRLSLKNCQAIERGYDLDELAKNYLLDKYLPNSNQEDRELWYITNDWSIKVVDIIKNFCIELMSDKKFSEGDVIEIAEYIRVASQSSPSVRTKDLFAEYQSLQQTEWDVEIEMRSKDIDELRESHEGFLNNPNLYVPKLDADACIILKLAKS